MPSSKSKKQTTKVNRRTGRMARKTSCCTKPQLPPELTDRIIDYLHQHLSDLRACALVCKAWVPSCRFHLFYGIHVIARTDNALAACRKLYDLFYRSPHIAPYVRELIVSDRYGPQLTRLEGVLIPLLRYFTNLRKLELDSVEWDTLTPDMRKLFADILALPTLVHFKTLGSSFPELKQFNTLLRPHLKRLSVCITWLSTETAGAGSALDGGGQDTIWKQERCRLDHLDLSVSFRDPVFIKWLLGPQSIINLSNLRTLHVVFEPVGTMEKLSTVAQMELMKSLSSSLEHITICFFFAPLNMTAFADIVSPGYQPNLLSLHVIGSIQLNSDISLFLKFVVSSLVAPRLQYICLSIGYGPIKSIHWMEIDRVLNNQAFGSLRTVRILLERCYVDHLHKDLIEQFPLLTSKGILQVVEAHIIEQVNTLILFSGNIDLDGIITSVFLPYELVRQILAPTGAVRSFEKKGEFIVNATDLGWLAGVRY